MQPDPKAVVQARLKALGMTQIQLADQLKTTPASVGQTLSSPLLRPDSLWPALLEALGLELVVRPKARTTPGAKT